MTRKHKPRTKEALLDKAESLNIDVDPDIH